MAKDKNKKVPFNVFKKGFVGALLGATILAGGVGLAGCGQAGQQGPQGEQGPAGTNGSTWYSGTQYDPAQGVAGDFFFDTDDGSIYVKLASGWTAISNITGPKGDTGEDGKDGASWLTGTTEPTAAVGKNGDTYLDISTNFVYTKTNGVWIKMGEISGDRDVTIVDQSPWVGKTAVFVGDSITKGSGCDGQKYWEILEEELGFSTVAGMGIGGSCWSATSDYGNGNSPLINRYQTIPEADLIQIFMGTNDYGHATPLGTIEDTTDVSFYGALNVILPALQQKYPSSRIVVVTPLHRYNADTNKNDLNYDYEAHPVSGKTLKDYVDAMKEVCERYSIPVIDMFSISGLNPIVESIKNMYMPDGLHPNAEGHKLMANIMKYHLNLFARGGHVEIVNPEYEYEIKVGNAFSTDPATLTSVKRASAVRNIQLKAGTVITVKDDAKYGVAVYAQTGEAIEASSSISGGFKDTFAVTEDGWYGFVLATDDDSDFNFLTMSKEFYDYVTITPPTPTPEQPGDGGEGQEPTDPTPGEGEDDGEVAENALVTGNKFGSTDNVLSDKTRATATKNIYINGTATITAKSAAVKVAVYAQTGEEITASSSISGGYKTEFSITAPGWYGFVLAKEGVEFDFSTDSDDLYDYISIDINEIQTFEVTFEIGSKYGAGYEEDVKRASTVKNVYLTAGTTIVKANDDYAYAVYKQTGETEITTGSSISGGWNSTTFVITESGWYGFALKKVSEAAFDFESTDSADLASYVTIYKA